MAIGKVSKDSINNLKPGARDAFLWDDKLKGFGAKISPAGRITYVAQYRIAGRGSPTRRVTVGAADKLTPAEARTEARAILSRAALKDDEAEKRSRLRKESTVGDVADQYLREYVPAHNKPSTQAEAARVVKVHIKPALGNLKLSALTRKKVREWHSALHKTPYEANRALAYLSRMMSLAVTEWEIAQMNPCLGLKRFPEQARDRFLTEEELLRLGQTLDACEADGTVPTNFAAVVRMLSLTGCRLSEMLNLTWPEVDADNAVIRLKDAKAGGRPVALGSTARAILKGRERGESWVFPAPSGEPMTRHSFHKLWKVLRARAGLHDVRAHDLRHTAATYAAQAGFNAFTVRDLLGHKTMAMAGRYVSRSTDPVQAAIDAVDSRVSRALAGLQGASNVVELLSTETD